VFETPSCLSIQLIGSVPTEIIPTNRFRFHRYMCVFGTPRADVESWIFKVLKVLALR